MKTAETPGQKDQKRKQTQIQPRLLSEIHAAQYLGISRSLLRQFAQAGRILPIRPKHWSGIGFVNRVLYDVHDLDELVESWKAGKK